MAVYKSGEPFKHLHGEYFLGDLGYVGANHMIHPWKKNEEPPNAEAGVNLDHAVSVVRSRIERTFAWIDRYHLFCTERIATTRR